MERRIPRVLFAGTNSGCGKTTVTCAVLQAFVNRGLKTGAMKCGPDYIDPMFHSRIIGAAASNLDSFFFTPNTLRCLLGENGKDKDVAVLEGVMGYYDGLSMSEPTASTYEVARLTDTPVILIVNARGASRSVLASIHGFLTFQPDSGIRGVVLNQCTAMTYQMLKKAILEQFGGRIVPLGFFPQVPEAKLESRHLGLITAQEIADLREKMQLLAAQAEKSLDLDGILSLAAQASTVSWEPIHWPKMEPVRIGVAQDNAFCFYYGDSLRALERMGAKLVPFSPLEDPELPANLHGLYLGGGYPELYSEALSKNHSMLRSIQDALGWGLPCIAECGGFMYLTEAIGEHPAARVLPGTTFDTGRLVRFGYIRLRAKKDNLLCRAGEEIPAHEFHHWDAENAGSDFEAIKPSGRSWTAAVGMNRLYAGFPHFHFYANPQFAVRFYEACLEEKHHD